MIIQDVQGNDETSLDSLVNRTDEVKTTDDKEGLVWSVASLRAATDELTAIGKDYKKREILPFEHRFSENDRSDLERIGVSYDGENIDVFYCRSEPNKQDQRVRIRSHSTFTHYAIGSPYDGKVQPETGFAILAGQIGLPAVMGATVGGFGGMFIGAFLGFASFATITVKAVEEYDNKSEERIAEAKRTLPGAYTYKTGGFFPRLRGRAVDEVWAVVPCIYDAPDAIRQAGEVLGLYEKKEVPM